MEAEAETGCFKTVTKVTNVLFVIILSFMLHYYTVTVAMKWQTVITVVILYVCCFSLREVRNNNTSLFPSELTLLETVNWQCYLNFPWLWGEIRNDKLDSWFIVLLSSTCCLFELCSVIFWINPFEISAISHWQSASVLLTVFSIASNCLRENTRWIGHQLHVRKFILSERAGSRSCKIRHHERCSFDRAKEELVRETARVAGT